MLAKFSVLVIISLSSHAEQILSGLVIRSIISEPFAEQILSRIFIVSLSSHAEQILSRLVIISILLSSQAEQTLSKLVILSLSSHAEQILSRLVIKLINYQLSCKANILFHSEKHGRKKIVKHFKK